MRSILAAGALVVLIALSACGSDAVDEPGQAAPTEKVSTSPDECTLHARTWAVKSDAFDTASLTMAEATLDEAYDAMEEASDQWEISGCDEDTEIRRAMLEGQYEAAVVAAKVRGCVIQAQDVCQDAFDEWEQKGAPLVAKVRSLSGLD